MNKKLILWIIVLLALVFCVNAKGYSNFINDTGDQGLDGSFPNLNDALTTTGWTNIEGSARYDNDHAPPTGILNIRLYAQPVTVRILGLLDTNYSKFTVYDEYDDGSYIRFQDGATNFYFLLNGEAGIGTGENCPNDCFDGSDTWRTFIANVTTISGDSNLTVWRESDGLRCCSYNIQTFDVMTFSTGFAEMHIDDLYIGWDNGTASAVGDTSNVDILFSNQTHPNTWKTLFNDGEKIMAYANFTINGISSVNNSNASCNISFVEGNGEVELVNDSFSLCSSGCDFEQYNETLNFLHITNAYASDIRFKACSSNLPTLPFFVNLNCSTGSITYEIPASDIPLCALGSAQFNFTSATCHDVNYVNISFWIEGNHPATKTKIITDAHVDRKFTVHLYENITFNTSLNMFQIPHYTEYHLSGSKRVYANCSYTPDPTLNNGADENITITNIAPRITFQIVNNSNVGVYMLTDGMTIEYADGLWSFYANVDDNEIDTINYTIQANNGTMIFSVLNSSNMVVEIDSSEFVDFPNSPFNFSICANDTFGAMTCDSLNFSINDTVDPVCTGFSDASVDENTYYTWDVSCVDESLYSFNITCSDGWNYTIYGMNEQTFTFTNQTSVNITNICSYRICDGHTDKDINDVKVDKLKDKLIFDNIVTIESLDESVSFDVEKFSDRYKFELELITKTDQLSFIVESRSKIEIIENSEYIGHIVADNLYWIDFVSKDVIDAQITRLNDKIVMVNLTLDKEVKKIKFDSIGLLNCIDGVITLTAGDTNPYDNALPTDWSLDMDTSTTAGVMILFFYLALICIVFILGSVLKIPVLIFLASSMMFFLGFIIAFELSILFGIMTCFVALVLLIVGALML